ncbi:MAG: hypothetical protein V4577_20890, partial [Bacteroidota bacterium]
MSADPARPQHPEFCICAAIRLADGRVIRGHRHDDCVQTALKWKAAGQEIGHLVSEQQGFVTSRNRFVGREEAMRLQKALGARSMYSPDGNLHGDILFSEDLY